LEGADTDVENLEVIRLMLLLTMMRYWFFVWWVQNLPAEMKSVVPSSSSNNAPIFIVAVAYLYHDPTNSITNSSIITSSW
jgi:hypothetical protein